MRFLAYARVSIEKNVEDLEGQMAALKRWGKANEHTVEVRQEVQSGAAGSGRPVFESAMEDVISGRFDGLVVQRLDRFGRSLSDILATADRLKRAGRHFVAFDNHLHLTPDGHDPMNRMFFQILAVFAEFEREIMKQRLAAGREAARAKGKHLGRPPLKLPIKEIYSLWKKGVSKCALGNIYKTNEVTIAKHLRRYEAKEFPYGPKRV